ncbi:MAG: GNAT family acetyltransferase [Eubacterium sp.]|nr:GNAT family acetyltransferase [Eubacterium sp.]
MIKRNELLTLNFYKKEPFTGSYHGMRYRIEKMEEDGSVFLLAATYPQPFCFTATDNSLKTFEKFDFSEQGLCDAADWLNTQYENNPEKWKSTC